MELDLAFEAVMDVKEVEEAKQEQATAASMSSATAGSNMSSTAASSGSASSSAASKAAAQAVKKQISTMVGGWVSGSLLQKNVKTDQHLYLNKNTSSLGGGAR